LKMSEMSKTDNMSITSMMRDNMFATTTTWELGFQFHIMLHLN
jgi:hypothetical protein